MRFSLALGCALLAAALGTIASQAQTTNDSQMQKFTRSDFYEHLVDRAVAALPRTVFQRCPSLVSRGSTVTIIKAVSFGTDGFPDAGLWRQTFPVSGCGSDTVLNFYFSARADEKIDTIVGVPGSTRADPTLQGDATKYAVIRAFLLVEGCKAFDVKDTKFEGFGLADPVTPDPGADSRYRPWWETWTLIGCGRTVDVPIGFAPHAKGTGIIQHGGTVR